MPRTPEEEIDRANRRDKHDKAKRVLRDKVIDLKAWLKVPPVTNSQRDKMAADTAKAVVVLNQRVNLLEGGNAVKLEDLVDPD